MSTQPFFSIIVPVYNVENYLRQCIQSVLDQKKITYELILVDDGSTDSSGAICDDFQLKFPKVIKVYHKENQGQSAARNFGIDHATGKYLFFLDSDDYLLFDKALYTIYKAADNQEIIAFEWKEIFEGGKWSLTEISYEMIQETNRYNGPAFLEKILTIHPGIPWYPCMYVYLNTYIQKNKLRFPLGHVFEDVVFTPRAIIQANRISAIPIPVYGYRRNRSGSTTTTVKRKSLEDFLIAISENVDFVLNQNNLSEELKRKLCSNFAEGYFSVMINVYALPAKEDQNIIIDKLKKFRYLSKYAQGKKQRGARILMNTFGIMNAIRILNLRRVIKRMISR